MTTSRSIYSSLIDAAFQAALARQSPTTTPWQAYNLLHSAVQPWLASLAPRARGWYELAVKCYDGASAPPRDLLQRRLPPGPRGGRVRPPAGCVSGSSGRGWHCGAPAPDLPGGVYFDVAPFGALAGEGSPAERARTELMIQLSGLVDHVANLLGYAVRDAGLPGGTLDAVRPWAASLVLAILKGGAFSPKTLIFSRARSREM